MGTLWRMWLLFPATLTACLGVPQTEEQAGQEGHKNLEAIRSILSSPPYRSSYRSSETSQPIEQSPAWPPDWLAGFFSPSSLEAAPGRDRPLYLFHGSDRPKLSPSSAQPPKVSLPWKPAMPSPMAAEEPFRPVPPYFNRMPGAPGDPNGLRCVPDYAGGSGAVRGAE